MRWGILSTANIARRVVAGAELADGVELTAVASRSLERAQAYASEHGIARAHGSYEALLADPEVDAIYNPLPNALHVDWSIRALAAGKHVLCEKPLTADPALAERAFDAAERADRVLMEAFMWRFHPHADQLVELVRDGRLGRLRYVRATFGFALAGADVRWSRELAGGALMDVGCYCVSALRLICGEPERVSAELVAGGDGVDARLVALLRFPGDVLGSFDTGLDVAPRSGIELVGDAATLVVQDPWHGADPVLTLRRGDAVETLPVAVVDPYARELEEVEAAVRERRPPRLDRAESVAQARTLAALYRAARERRSIAL